MSNLEDYANIAVPETEGPRFKWLYLTNVEVGVAICVPVFMFGAALGHDLSAKNLILSLLASGFLLSLIAGWSSFIGVKTRLSTPLLVKKAFGEKGAPFVWFVLGLSLFGWFGVQTEICSTVFLTLMNRLDPTLSLNKTLVTFLAGLLMSTTAILGIKGVGKLAQLSMPLLLGVMFYALGSALSEKGLSAWLTYTPQTAMPIGTAIAAIVGGYSVGAIVMPDIKRFAIDKTHSIVAAILALGVFYPLLLILTALTAVLMQQPDFMILLINLGLGPLALLILMLATWTTNDMNLYSASLNLTPLFPKLSREVLTAISGVLGSIIATFGLFEHMVPLFMLLGVLTTPVLAIYSAAYLIEPTEQLSPSINKRAFFIWIFASALGLASTPTDQWGLGLVTLTTVPGLDSLLASLLLCGIAAKSSFGKASRRAA